MKGMKICLGLLGVCCILVLCSSFVLAADGEASGPISVTFDNTYASKYVSRGIAYNSEASYQPSVTVSHESGWSLNVWATNDTTGINDNKGRITETDYTVNREWQVGNRCFNGGWIHYDFPNSDVHSTDEVYAGVSLDTAFQPSMTLFYDFNQGRALYTVLGAGYCCKLPGSKEITPSMDLGMKLGWGTSNYGKYNFGAAKSGFTDLLLSAALPIKINSQMKATPSLSYSKVINGTLRDSFDAAGIANDNWVGGLTVSCDF